ncbi:MAG: outer membrane beta-barrel protein [Deltaproteobacteria bacterium]|nr:outer membrane beta-barrel protein [Deltaproteobacteria bacterium]
MKNISIYFTSILLLLLITHTSAAMAEGSSSSDNRIVQSALSGIKVTGGISAGYFYASNPGEDTSGDQFLLSNLLVEFSSADEDLPMGFVGALGRTSTPSILDAPENNTDLMIEYASLAMKPLEGLGIEAGLLQPNAGFENTYTYNNNNIFFGAVASQQPYNAYGARLDYDIDEFSFSGGYYMQRLDDEEYNSPDYAWEIGVSAAISDNDLSVYNYHIAGKRNLLGAVIERTIEGVYLAFNIDYWTLDDDANEPAAGDSSIGAAFYICPSLGSISVPVRLEYINQDTSGIYIEDRSAKGIYAATLSPTYHFFENAYIRAESAYVKADSGFSDQDGHRRDSRIDLAVEIGFLF